MAYQDTLGQSEQAVEIAQPYPMGAVPLAVSATVSAAANNQTLAGVSGKTTYITGFDLSGTGATGASTITVTVTGLTNTLSFFITIPAGVGTAVFANQDVLQIRFPMPIPASGLNTAIVVNVPSYGTGNTNAGAAAYGYQL